MNSPPEREEKGMVLPMMQPRTKERVHPAAVLTPAGEEILHFALAGLLPDDCLIALNTVLGTVCVIASSPDEPYSRLLAEEQFTASELSVLLPLLRAYPQYCPYEVTLASFTYGGNLTDDHILRAQQRLEEAKQEGDWDQEMKPVHNVLSRTRLKMRHLGIEISSIIETGHLLRPFGTARKHLHS